MKRVMGILLALFFVIGLATSAGAALTFDVDFWATGNPVHNYAQGGPGDLGQTFILNPGESINVDLYFTTDLEIDVGASWDLQYNPAALASVTAFTPPGSPWAGPLTNNDQGSFKYQGMVFPGSSVTGEFQLGSVQFQYGGMGDVDLYLDNYLGFLTLNTTNTFTPTNIGTLSQTPIPAAVWLLGAGLASLAGIRRIGRPSKA